MTLTEFIKDHAEKHYEDGGWDVVVECWSDKEITDHLTEYKVTNEAQALDAFAFMVDVWADRQAEARYQGEQ